MLEDRGLLCLCRLHAIVQVDCRLLVAARRLVLFLSAIYMRLLKYLQLQRLELCLALDEIIVCILEITTLIVLLVAVSLQF